MGSEQEGFQLGDRFYVWDEVYEEGDNYEVHSRPDGDLVFECVSVIRERIVRIVSETLQLDFWNHSKAIPLMLYNPKTGNYTAIHISIIKKEAGFDQHYRRIHITDAQGLDIEAVVTDAASASDVVEDHHLEISLPRFRMFASREHIMRISNDKTYVGRDFDIVRYINQISQGIDGVVVDPYEEVYGSMTDRELLEVYFKDRRVYIDFDRKVVLVEDPKVKVVRGRKVCEVFTRDDALFMARRKLEGDLYGRFSDLPIELSRIREEKASQ